MTKKKFKKIRNYFPIELWKLIEGREIISCYLYDIIIDYNFDKQLTNWKKQNEILNALLLQGIRFFTLPGRSEILLLLKFKKNLCEESGVIITYEELENLSFIEEGLKRQERVMKDLILKKESENND